MATLTVTLPSGSSVCDGKQVTFKAPCDSKGVTDIIINGVPYSLVDAMGESVSTGNSYKSGVMVSVILDTTGKKAYIQNAVNNCIGKIIFTDTTTDWNGPTNSLYTLTKEVGLAKVISVYKGNDTSGYKAVEVDNIEISAGGTLTVTSPATFEGFILLSSSIAFDSSVADIVDAVIDGKVDDKFAKYFNAEGHLVLPSGVELW